MKYKNGFLYPFVDEADCISCGKCVKTCQINNCLEKSGLKNAYLAVAKDNAIYEKGSSGGVFGVFAHYFIEVLKGAVCGVMMDEDCNVKHCVIDKVEEIPKLQGSKYVQSDLTGIFEQMESLLKRGVQVLFCGTPCQVASMKTVFSNYPNLFLIDLVCHGVPSPQLLKNHIAQNIAPGETVKEVRFRTKEQYDRYGFNLLVKTNEKERLLAGSVDPYYRLFLASASFRMPAEIFPPEITSAMVFSSTSSCIRSHLAFAAS
jgi:coenzyme F420-reducing hydrogenase beta subunit